MAQIEGFTRFSARRADLTPLALPYEKLATDTTIIKKGHPVVLYSGNLVRRILLVSGSAFPASGKILGFSAEDEQAVTSAEYGNQFAMMPKIKRPSGREEIKVFVADGVTIFQAAVRSGQAATTGLIGTNVGLSYDPVRDQFSVDTNQTTYPVITVINIVPKEEGAVTGRVDFVIANTRSQYLTGL
jgi:hypothetical protein